MRKLQIFGIILAICTLLAACGGPQANAPISGGEAVQVEAGKEVKISADGKVSSGDQVLSEGGRGSVATGCDITVRSDGTIVVSTEKGDYSVCKDYPVTIPAKTAQTVQVSTPEGQKLTVSGSGFAADQVIVTESGAVETSQGSIKKDADKVVFSTEDGDYTILPATAVVRLLSTRSAGACQVKKPNGEVVQVREPLSILSGSAMILPDGTVETADGMVSMLQDTATITTKAGVYTVRQEETVIAEETTVVLPVAVLDPAGNVISNDGKTLIPEGNIVVQSDGSLMTVSGTICVGENGVSVKPLEAEQKVMTLPNGDVIDITNAQILEDGTVYYPAVVYEGGGISPEMYITPDGYCKEQFYFRMEVQIEGNVEFFPVLKDDPAATHVETFLRDLHYMGQPVLERNMKNIITGNLYYSATTVLDAAGNVIQEEYQSEGERFVDRWDAFGRNIYHADYIDSKNIAEVQEKTYLVDSPLDQRLASHTMSSNGQMWCIGKYDANGQLAYEERFADGVKTATAYYQNGAIVRQIEILPFGNRVTVNNADGTRKETETQNDGNCYEKVWDTEGRLIREQSWKADGTSENYSEYLYNVDGWATVTRKYWLKPYAVTDQFGNVLSRWEMEETCDNDTQRAYTVYEVGGSVWEKTVTDKQTNTQYSYDGRDLLTGVNVSGPDGTSLRSEIYRYDDNGNLMFKEIYDYENNRYSRYDGAGNLVETFQIRS